MFVLDTSPDTFTDTLRDTTETLKDHVQSTKEYRQKQEERYERDDYQKCHQLFKTSRYEDFKNINPMRAEQTCRWVFENDVYNEWQKKASDGLLWISADPGCGKSVLSRSLVDYELQDPGTTVCHFFLKDNEEQNSLATALCAILHQLFANQPVLIRHAVKPFKQNSSSLQTEISELWKILLAAMSDEVARNTYCVFDALDECRDGDRESLINMLSRFHRDAAESRDTDKAWLKFLVTSRPYADIQTNFRNGVPPSFPIIRLRGEQKDDQISEEINHVISIRVSELAEEFGLDPEIKRQLETNLKAQENRTYLWLHLVLEDFKSRCEESLWPDEETIQSLPSSVEDAYGKILRKAKKNSNQIETRTVLCIVLGARHSLTLDEMALALSAEKARVSGAFRSIKLKTTNLEDRLRHWCGLFIFTRHQRIYLIHQTAREFLLHPSSDLTVQPVSGYLGKHCISGGDVQSTMAMICVYITCLHADHNPDFSVLPEDRDFITYSRRWWADHVRAAPAEGVSSIMDKLLTMYDTSSSLWLTWVWEIWHYRPGLSLYSREAEIKRVQDAKTTSIILAAFNGHNVVLERLLDHRKEDINHIGVYVGTAIYFSCRLGYEKTVELLLKQDGIDVNAGEPLAQAAAKGHKKIIELLLQQDDVDVNAGKPLARAAYSGSKEIVEFLLQQDGIDVDAMGLCWDRRRRDSGEETALIFASYQGHHKIVRLLLSYGANVEFVGDEGTALTVALSSGHSKVAHILLSHGASIHGGIDSAIETASVKGHTEIIDLLMAHKQDQVEERCFGSKASRADSSPVGESDLDDSEARYSDCPRRASKRRRLLIDEAS